MMELRCRRDKRNSRDLARVIKVALQGYRCRREVKAGSAVESLFASDLTLIREAWIRMLVWYKESLDRHPPPARVDLVTMCFVRS